MSATNSSSARQIDSTRPFGSTPFSININHAKTCSVCGTLKTEDNFRRIGFTGKLSGVCKECERKKRNATIQSKKLYVEEVSVEVNGRHLKRVTRATDSRGITSDKFCGITTRELLSELEARGYKWDNMWLEKVEVHRLQVLR